MSFTSVTVVGTFHDQTGSPASGTLTFTLTQPMQNGDVIVDPQPVVVTLDSSGHFSTVLLANDDSATTPVSVQYGVTETLAGAQPRDYFVVVSQATSPVDLSTLMPAGRGWT